MTYLTVDNQVLHKLRCHILMPSTLDVVRAAEGKVFDLETQSQNFWPLLTSMEAVGLCWTCLGL